MIKFLANKFPNKNFFGIDLPNGQLNIKKSNKDKNLKLILGDFHNLSNYLTGSMDIVYVIEALCHASNRLRVMSEVYSVLKPGGYFIVFDGYYKRQYKSLNNDEKLAGDLLFKSMMVNTKDHYYPNFKKDLEKSKLTVVKEENLTEAVMPSLYRLEAKAEIYINHPRFAFFLKKILPSEFLGNSIAGYLFPTTMKEGIFCYYLTVSQKKRKINI